MDRERFDTLTRLFATRGSRRSALAALLGGILLAQNAPSLPARRRKGKGKKKPPAKVLVCHNGETLSVSRSAVRGIELDGGFVGPCPTGAATGGGCIQVDQLCNKFGGPSCCSPTVCQPTLAPLVTTCQLGCTSDQDCANRLGTSDVSCVADAGACPFHPKCCRPKTCTSNSDCPTNGLCCRNQNSFTGLCCLSGQKCTPGIGCQAT